MALIRRVEAGHQASSRGHGRFVGGLEELEPRTLLSLVLPLQPTDVWNAYQVESSVAADFDGDGLTDLVASQLNRIAFFKGNADGTFQHPPIVTVLPARVGVMVGGLFNGDQRMDIASIAPVASTTAGAPPVGLLVRVMYFDPATGQFGVGARLRVGSASEAAATPRIAAENFVSGWRDEIVVGMGPATDIRLLRLPDRSTLVQHSVLLAGTGHLLAMAAASDLPHGTAGRAEVMALVQEQFSTALLAVPVFADYLVGHSTFHVQSFAADSYSSLAIGDVDGDGLKDVVLGGPNIALVRAVDATTFAAAQTLMVEPSGGQRRVDAVFDVDDDGRMDILWTQVLHQSGRLESTQVQPSVAIQRSDGTFGGFNFGWSDWEYDHYPAEDTRVLSTTIVARVGTQHRAALAQTGRSVGLDVSVMTDELFGPRVGQPVLGYDLGPGGSVLRTGNVSEYAVDQDPMRGGHVVRVDFIVDLNNSGGVDNTDPALATAMTPLADGTTWRASFTMPTWTPGMYRLFARAYDNDGLVATSVVFWFTVYP